MDRTDTSRDAPGEQATGSAAAPGGGNVDTRVEPVRSRPVDQCLGDLLAEQRPRIHRAPPRPLVPMAYKRALPLPHDEFVSDAIAEQTSDRAEGEGGQSPPVALSEALPTPFGPHHGGQFSVPQIIQTSTIATISVVQEPAAFAARSAAVPVATDSVPRPSIGEKPHDETHRQAANAAIRWRWFRTAMRIAGFAVAAYFAMIFALLIAYRFVDPPLSSLMLQQRLSGVSVTSTWTDLDNISPQIVRAVLLSEDGRFCQHRGVDLLEMQAAIERAGDGVPRGASTISMQVIKNLFLWPSKSYVRKALEIPLTFVMELLWTKRRIMEVYLNIAEWGPGIFGVGAASQFHFEKAASRLNEREAAQLAVALPNPYSRDAGDPGPQTRRLASDIQNRMRSAYPSQTACVLGIRPVR